MGIIIALQGRHNERDGVSSHQLHDCLLNRLFRRRSKKTSKLRVTGLCEGNSPVIGEFTAQRASNAETVSIWWRHDDILYLAREDEPGARRKWARYVENLLYLTCSFWRTCFISQPIFLEHVVISVSPVPLKMPRYLFVKVSVFKI